MPAASHGDKSTWLAGEGAASGDEDCKCQLRREVSGRGAWWTISRIACIPPWNASDVSSDSSAGQTSRGRRMTHFPIEIFSSIETRFASKYITNNCYKSMKNCL